MLDTVLPGWEGRERLFKGRNGCKDWPVDLNHIKGILLKKSMHIDHGKNQSVNRPI